ncbi:hypothetical protein LuPra_05230 [Luteitalea pratensis]|uniref:Uncharacterized protein n=1 Tax=Luteitalea pratensis TaxID=1855912 RepID=A0A143PV71_LUTPR|nr:hypothetical protein LuPra_05230 [Luteitalea pratensis]
MPHARVTAAALAVLLAGGASAALAQPPQST